MIANIGDNTFFVFMGFDVIAAVFCFFLVTETRGKNLEAAAGTEWDVAEVDGNASDAGEIVGKGDAVVVEEDGKALGVVGARNTFGKNILHRKR